MRSRTAAGLALGARLFLEARSVPGGEMSPPGPRLEVAGLLRGLAVAATEGGATQHPGIIGTLSVGAEFSRMLRGHVEFQAQGGGPIRDGHAGVASFVHTFQDLSPSLRLLEAWGEARFHRAELRVGVQRFAWGVLDGIPPNDVLNPMDLHDPFVVDPEDAKLGVPAVQVLVYPPDVPGLSLNQLRAALVYVPIAVPPWLPELDERWFPPAARPPPFVILSRDDIDEAFERHLPLSTGNPTIDGVEQVTVARDVHVPVGTSTQNRRPPKQLDAGGVGFRLSGTRHGLGWDLYHYTGPETGPNLDLPVQATITSATLGCMSENPTGCALSLSTRSHAELRQTHDTIHLTGADATRAIGDVTVRAEAAFGQGRRSLRIASDLLPDSRVPRRALLSAVDRELADCLSRGFEKNISESGGAAEATAGPCSGPVVLGDLFVKRNEVAWGIGADYLWRDIFFLGQVNQIVGLTPTPRLLLANPDTRLSATVRRAVLLDRLQLELRGSYELSRGGWFLFPMATYAFRDAWKFRVAFLALGGSRNSLYGQFGKNDEAVFEISYAF